MPDEQSGTKRTSVNFVQQNEQEGTKRAYVPHRGQEKITNDSKAKQKKQMVFPKTKQKQKKPLSMLRTLTTARRDMECAPRFPPPMVTEIKGGFKHHDKLLQITAIQPA